MLQKCLRPPKRVLVFVPPVVFAVLIFIFRTGRRLPAKDERHNRRRGLAFGDPDRRLYAASEQKMER